jgi:hypothetical protein
VGKSCPGLDFSAISLPVLVTWTRVRRWAIDIARRQWGEALRTARDDRDPPETLRDLRLLHQGFDTAGEQVVKRSDDCR